MDIINNLKEIVKDTNIFLEEKDLFSFLKIEKRWPIRYPWDQSSVEIIDNIGKLRNNFIFNYDGYLNFDYWLEMYNLGYTTILSNILDLNEDLRNLQKTIRTQVGIKINGNFYFSKTGQTPSFDEHSHPYNVIVKQIYGNVHWRINNKEFILKPQESILIPKNTKHQVFFQEEKKLSLTLNIE
jgi:mannose-6-phosphate isomerase-like protein (cupin superfamily)